MVRPCSSDTLASPTLVDSSSMDASMETSNGEWSNQVEARLDALQILQQLQGMNHPDVLFAVRHLARAHRRRGDIELSLLIEEMVQSQQMIQSQETLACL